MTRQRPYNFFEFFAGGGMARAGLGADWCCAFANDFDRLKAETYRANWGGEHLLEGDVWDVSAAQLPGCADLAWASSPCQDLSLAGARTGLGGPRSSAFWGFWRLIETLRQEARAPLTLVIENVSGLMTSAGGSDFRVLCEALRHAGYCYGALEIDASHFLPQSRPRLFLVASRLAPSAALTGASPFHTPAVMAAHARLDAPERAAWVWWAVPAPRVRNSSISEVLVGPEEAPWAPQAATDRLVSLLAPRHRERLAAAGSQVGLGYRRMRREGGRAVQRLEVRTDGLAGCLRTPRGGSSRQYVIQTAEGLVQSRRLTAREGARLMGLSDDYRLPQAETAALHVIGDGVVVPVVRHLAAHLLEPLLATTSSVLAAE